MPLMWSLVATWCTQATDTTSNWIGPVPSQGLTCGVMPHQKLEYAPVESSMGATTDLFSAIRRLRVSGLVRTLSVSANWRERLGRAE